MDSIKQALLGLWHRLIDYIVGRIIWCLAVLLLLVAAVLWRHMISTITIPYLLFYSLLIPPLVIVGWLVFGFGIFQPFKRKYQQDIFGGILWRWGYTWRGKPKDIHGFCLKDDMELACTNDDVTDGGDKFVCEKCHDRFSGHVTDTDFVRRQIDLKIRNGTWAERKL
jgi:hypothetical protein